MVPTVVPFIKTFAPTILSDVDSESTLPLTRTFSCALAANTDSTSNRIADIDFAKVFMVIIVLFVFSSNRPEIVYRRSYVGTFKHLVP